MSMIDHYKQAKADKTLKTLTPTYIEWKAKGDTIIGIYKGVAEVASSRGEGTYNQYLVETDNGMVKFALGSATDREIALALKTDRLYAFEFKEKVSIGGGRSVNKFEVSEIPMPDPIEGKVGDDIPF